LHSSSGDVGNGGGSALSVGSLGLDQGDDAGQQQQQQQKGVGCATRNGRTTPSKRSNQELQTKSNEASEPNSKRHKAADSAVTGTHATTRTEAEAAAATSVAATRRSTRSRVSLQELPGDIIRVDGMVSVQGD
jgi:hypothetical protein